MSQLFSRFTCLFFLSGFSLLTAQTLTCQASAFPPLVRAEGITERVADMVLACSNGSPGANVNGNLTLFMNVNITNRVASNGSNQVSDMLLTVDNGSGPQPANVPGVLTGPGALTYNGLNFNLSSNGSVTLRFSGVRAAVNGLAAFPSDMVIAQFSFNAEPIISLFSNQLVVADAEPGLYVGFSEKIVCSQTGSRAPSNAKSFASFLASGAVFGTTRVTEGFADAFSPKSGFQGLNADTGTRIMVTYSGFPQGASIFVPSVVAGSDALQPTAGGDFGFPAAGGQYTPGNNGSLLLALVQGADSNGAGGSPVYVPGQPGSPTASFDAMTQVTLANGAGAVVYEVVDANPHVQESAQFPTFLVLTPFAGASVQTSEDVTFAPVSTVYTATAIDPIPRFQAITPQADCTIVGDCNASYFPRLFVFESSLQYTAQAGSNTQTKYITIHNTSGGVLQWNATLAYQQGSGWLDVSPTSGENDSGIRVDAIPGTLAPGAYNATLTVDAGPFAGTSTVAITLTITPAAPPPPVITPTITAAVNAATFATGPLTPGSLASIVGTNFSGDGLTATFDGTPAQIFFSNATQINLLVPAALAGKASSQLIVSAGGVSSAPDTVALAAFSPGIFNGGILNQDNSVNGPNHPAPLGSVIQIFATGLSGSGEITGNINGGTIGALIPPDYAGPAPGLLGVQQINLTVPLILSGTTANVSVCGRATPAQVVCSPTVPLAVAPASTN